jgi:hypothetical protein
MSCWTFSTAFAGRVGLEQTVPPLEVLAELVGAHGVTVAAFRARR